MKSNNSIGQFCFLLIHRKKQKRTGLKDIDTSPSATDKGRNLPAPRPTDGSSERTEPTVSTSPEEPVEETIEIRDAQKSDGFDEIKKYNINLHNLSKFL